MRYRRLIGAGIAAVLVVVAIALATRGSDGSSARVPPVETSPRLVTVSELKSLEDSLEHPVYWAGEQPSKRIELTQEATGEVYVRYLGSGIEAGDPRPEFLTVGTYLVPGARGFLLGQAKRGRGEARAVAGDGVALIEHGQRRDVYVAYPESDLEIEVYDPHPEMALRLIEAGTIRPIG